MKEKPDWKIALDDILDCFSGADGGISYVMLQGFIERMAEQSDSGDTSATELLNVMYRFNRLIKVANRNL